MTVIGHDQKLIFDPEKKLDKISRWKPLTFCALLRFFPSMNKINFLSEYLITLLAFEGFFLFSVKSVGTNYLLHI